MLMDGIAITGCLRHQLAECTFSGPPRAPLSSARTCTNGYGLRQVHSLYNQEESNRDSGERIQARAIPTQFMAQ